MIKSFLYGFILLSTTAAFTQVANSQSNPALEAAIASVRANPSNPEASFRLAQAAAEARDFRTAISALERILILNPQLANIRLELGILYLRAGSPELAKRYISKALESSDIPPEVRTRAEDLQKTATSAGKRLRFAGSVSVGLISDDNANAGPNENTSIGAFTIDPNDAGQADVSAFAAISGRLRYDLGMQAGHLAAVDVDLYTRQYADQTDQNLTRVGVALGADLNTARVFGFPSDILVRYNFSHLTRDGDEYLSTHGPSLTFRAATQSGLQFDTNIYSFNQNYFTTKAAAANDNRDGRETGLSISLSRALNENSAGDITISGVSKSARANFEAYQQMSVAAGYTRQFDQLYDFGDGKWIMRISAKYTNRDYDAPDPVISATQAQSDDILSVNGSLSIPLNDTSALRTEVGHISSSSNYALDSYDNTYVSVSFNRRF